MKLKKCIAKNKVTILPDGNCIFGALSWWLTEKEDFHGLVRIKLVEFMRKSALCERYVRNKSEQSIEDYIIKTNMTAPTVWGSDVELFSASIWLETEIFVL